MQLRTACAWSCFVRRGSFLDVDGQLGLLFGHVHVPGRSVESHCEGLLMEDCLERLGKLRELREAAEL